MHSVERIEVRNIFVGSAFKFGLLYGLIIGLIMGIIALITGMLGNSVGGNVLTDLLPAGGAYVFSVVVFLFYFVKN